MEELPCLKLPAQISQPDQSHVLPKQGERLAICCEPVLFYAVTKIAIRAGNATGLNRWPCPARLRDGFSQYGTNAKNANAIAKAICAVNIGQEISFDIEDCSQAGRLVKPWFRQINLTNDDGSIAGNRVELLVGNRTCLMHDQIAESPQLCEIIGVKMLATVRGAGARKMR